MKYLEKNLDIKVCWKVDWNRKVSLKPRFSFFRRKFWCPEKKKSLSRVGCLVDGVVGDGQVPRDIHRPPLSPSSTHQQCYPTSPVSSTETLSLSRSCLSTSYLYRIYSRFGHFLPSLSSRPVAETQLPHTEPFGIFSPSSFHLNPFRSLSLSLWVRVFFFPFFSTSPIFTHIIRASIIWLVFPLISLDKRDLSRSGMFRLTFLYIHLETVAHSFVTLWSKQRIVVLLSSSRLCESTTRDGTWLISHPCISYSSRN